MKQKARTLFPLGALLGVILLLGCHRPSLLRWQGRTMGTTYHIQLINDSNRNLALNELQEAVDSLLSRINQQMSTYLPQSEISRFNRWASKKPFRVSPECLQVVRAAIRIYQETNGAFDITVGPLVDAWGFGKKGQRFEPPDSNQISRLLQRVGAQQLKICGDTALCKLNPNLEIDLSAIAKGYGVDAVSQLLKKKGFSNFMVEIGGEVYASGKKGKRKWRIGVDRPVADLLPGQDIEAVLEIQDMAVATSGDYRNFFDFNGKIYSHEIDPRTGWPVSNGLASVTVIAPDCMTADAMATAIMVMGAEKGLKLVNEKLDVEALLLKRQNANQFKAILSKGMPSFLLNGDKILQN